MARTRVKAKRRQRPLGAAIGAGLAVTMGVGMLILIVELLIPDSAVSNLFRLSHLPSATLAASPLFQQWKEAVNRQESLFDTPLSLLCGGLTLGWFAPRYATRRRVLVSAASMAFGILAVLLTFTWADNLYLTGTLNAHEGAWITRAIAPLGYVVRQAAWDLIWIAACVLGAWLGLQARDRRQSKDQGKGVPPPTRPAPREVAHR
jgi:hypothetical protein